MHDDEIAIDEPLVRELLASQFPDWADLPLMRVEPAGTDNAIFRLGAELAVRLPRIDWATDQAIKEERWLPTIAPLLPLEVPTPVAIGRPGDGYPWTWSICRWLDGEPATPDRLADPATTAADLARFIAALEAIDPADGPPPEGRGGPLAPRDERTRAAIASLGDAIDARRVTRAWDEALRAPAWSEPPVWIHGDLDARNLLAREGRLTGVLDFGSIAVGDPACDVMVTWKMLPPEHRAGFREALDVDDATWSRAKGWVVSQALLILDYYTPETNRVLVEEATRWLAEALADPFERPP